MQSWVPQVHLLASSTSSIAKFLKGNQGQGVINALLFSMGPVEYDIRPITRSVTSKLAKDITRDYPQLSLVQWQEGDTESIRQCFEGCYGAFITIGVSPLPGLSLKELSRAEIDLGTRCLEAAKVNHIRILSFVNTTDSNNRRRSYPM